MILSCLLLALVTWSNYFQNGSQTLASLRRDECLGELHNPDDDDLRVQWPLCCLWSLSLGFCALRLLRLLNFDLFSDAYLPDGLYSFLLLRVLASSRFNVFSYFSVAFEDDALEVVELLFHPPSLSWRRAVK